MRQVWWRSGNPLRAARYPVTGKFAQVECC